MPRFFIDVEARFAQFQDSLDKITANTGRSAKQMASAFDGVKSAIITLGGTLSAGAFGRALITAMREAEESSARLDSALRSTGGAVGIARLELDELAESMKGAFGANDDDIRKAEATLIRFGNIQGDVFKDALRLSADLAAEMGTGVAEAAQLLGRAIQSPTEGLRTLEQRYGKLRPEQEKFINDLARQGKALEAQREILKLFDEKIGGTAQAMNVGLTKSLRDITNAWDDFLKALGRTEGPMRIVRDAFGGLAVTLQFLNQLMTERTQIDEMSELADKIKAVNKEIDKQIEKKRQLSDTSSEEFAVSAPQQAAATAKVEKEINDLLKQRGALLGEHQRINDQLRRQREEELAKARAKQGEPKLGGGAKDLEQEKAFKRALEALHDQAAKIKGISQEEQTLHDIRRGAYGEVDAAQQKQLLNAARYIDALKKQEQVIKTMRQFAPQPLDVRWDDLEKFWTNISIDADKAQIELDKARDTLQRTTDVIMEAQPLDVRWDEVTQFWKDVAKNAEIAKIEIDKARESLQAMTEGRMVMGPPMDEEFEDLSRFWARQAAGLNGISEEARKLQRDAEDLGFTFQSAFEDAIIEGEQFSDVLKALEKDIARIILRMTVTRPLAEGLASWIGSFLTSGAGGAGSSGGAALQHGGPALAGRPYLVGEDGPELFVPRSSGTVVPSGEFGGITINNGDIIVSGSGVTMSEVRQALIASERRTIEAVREINRR